MKITNTIFFVLYFITYSHTVDCFHGTSKEDLKLERELNLINKSPIKSIHVFTHILIIGSLI